ncbi:hypothetical protein [Pseudomonas syringae]|uniref:hypothetical protein n=1 Tax=Pseudomonas syringae TaxID=317 RepID=UPI001F431BF3|nr:hypothetical protein [Pseudomonas syringae]
MNDTFNEVTTGKTNKVVLCWVVGVCFLTLAMVIFKQVMVVPHQPSQPGFLSDLIIVAARTTARNQKIDESTRLLRAEASDSHTLAFYYDLVSYDAHPAGFDLSATRLGVVKAVCDSQRLRESSILALGGTYVFIYGSKNIKEIGRFEVNKQLCDSAP